MPDACDFYSVFLIQPLDTITQTLYRMMSLLRYVFLLFFVCTALAEQITILGINDLHANMQRMPQVADVVKRQREAHPDLLLFAAGDHNTGNPVSDLSPVFRGWPMIDLMNRLGVDVSCVGNHEFDGGPDALRKAMDAARFPFVCANMHAPGALGLTHQPYVILECKGIKVGVLGLVTVTSSGYPSRDPSNMAAMSFDDPLQEALKYKWLRDECDVLILLTHIGYQQDLELARRFAEADAIVGGHSGTLLENGVVEQGVLITQAGDKAEAVTKLVFEVENGRVVSGHAETLAVDDARPDPVIAEVVAQYLEDPALQETLAQNVTEMNRLMAGSLLGEALMEEAGAEVALVNVGGIRVDSLPEGPLTVADVYRMDPFCNSVVRISLTGRELEQLVQTVIDDDNGRPACVAGMQYDYECREGQSPRAVHVRLPDGRPLEPDKPYVLATHSYLAKTALRGRPCETLDTTTEESLIRYLKKHQQVDFSQKQNVTLPEDLLQKL